MKDKKQEDPKKVALVCSNFTMQSAFGLLIIALNSVRLGNTTLIYFTFEGLNMIRPGGLEKLKYYPTGVEHSNAMVDKYTIRNNVALMLSQTARVEELKLTTTGGTSGLPLKFYIDQKISIPKEAAALYHLFRRFKYNPFARCVFLQGDILDESMIKKGVYWKRNYFRNGLVMSSFHLNDETVHQYVKRIREFQPHFIFAYPSSCTILSTLMKKNNLHSFKSLKYVKCSSENIYDWQRKLVGEVLGVKIFSEYGHSEKSALAGECEHSSHLHFSPYYGYAELINAHGELCRKDGELGEIVVTGFDHKDFVFIRYRTGDLAEYSSETCDCGRNFFTVKKIIGREQDFVVDQNGDLRVFTTAHLVFKGSLSKINAFQYFQSVKGELELRIEVNEALSSDEYELLRKEVQDRFVDFSVNIVEVDHIPRTKSGKFKYLQQNLKHSHNTFNTLYPE